MITIKYNSILLKIKNKIDENRKLQIDSITDIKNIAYNNLEVNYFCFDKESKKYRKELEKLHKAISKFQKEFNGDNYEQLISPIYLQIALLFNLKEKIENQNQF